MSDDTQNPPEDEVLAQGRKALEGAEVVSFGEAGAKVKEAKAAKAKKKEDLKETKDTKGPRSYRTMFRPRIRPDDDLEYVRALDLPDPCPVECLGQDGAVFSFLNPHGQLVKLEASKMGQSQLSGLFAGKLTWLCREFPQISASGTWKGFAAQYVAFALQEKCSALGIFDERERVRGRGCWLDPSGALVQHIGDQIIIGDKVFKPGVRNDYVYPGRPKVVPAKAAHDFMLIDQLYEDFKTWNFARHNLDARLLMGWIGCAILGGALDWRPMIFITGDAGTGKSALLNKLKAMLPGRLVTTADASSASLRQVAHHDSVGILFDEIEADALNDKAQEVMKLARLAASGATILRGGTDHNAVEFTLRGCFAFTAIIPPSMRQADMQRMSFLRLQPLRKGSKLRKVTKAEAEATGAAIAHRVTSQWARFEQTLFVYKSALEKIGHHDRPASQFGTLLAAADLIMGDEIPDEGYADKICQGLEFEALFEYQNTVPAWQTAFNTVLQAQPSAWQSDGGQTVAQVLRAMLLSQPASDEWKSKANKLEKAGLAVVVDRHGRKFLAIPPRHQAVAKMFAGGDFQAKGGEGAWSTVLRNAPPFLCSEDGNQATGIYRVDNVPRLQRAKCTQFWLDARYEGVPIFDHKADGDDVSIELGDINEQLKQDQAEAFGA